MTCRGGAPRRPTRLPHVPRPVTLTAIRDTSDGDRELGPVGLLRAGFQAVTVGRRLVCEFDATAVS